MKIYKVYAKCVRVAKGIKEITLDEAKELIQETVNEMLNNGDLNINLENEDNDNEFSEKFGELLDKAEEFLTKKDSLNVGISLLNVRKNTQVEVIAMAGVILNNVDKAIIYR